MAQNTDVPADNRILYFSRDRRLFGFLSHFYASPFVLDGEVWPTVEHYYQSQRSNDPAYRQAIRDAKSPAKVKYLSAFPQATSKTAKRSWFRRNNAFPRRDWPELKLGIMRLADRAKFAQNHELSEMLLATQDAELVEDSPWDSYWGSGSDCTGLNWAGRILMEVRLEMRGASSTTDETTAF